MWSTAVAIFAVGGMLGALIGPVIADSLGRYAALVFGHITARSGKGNHGGMLLHVTFQQMKSSSESK